LAISWLYFGYSSETLKGHSTSLSTNVARLLYQVQQAFGRGALFSFYGVTQTMSKRCNEKRISIVSQVLRYMRQSSGLSFNQAGRRLRLTGSAIAHMEHGRMEIPKHRIAEMVQIYGFSMDEFKERLSTKPVPPNPRDECVSIIRELDHNKVLAVYGLLVNFIK